MDSSTSKIDFYAKQIEAEKLFPKKLVQTNKLWKEINFFVFKTFRRDVPHYESKFQSLLMSNSYILRTRHFLLHTGHFFLRTRHFLLHTRSFLLQDSYHMTITMVIFCKQKGMDTLFCLFLYYFVMVIYLNQSDIIYNILTLF